MTVYQTDLEEEQYPGYVTGFVVIGQYKSEVILEADSMLSERKGWISLPLYYEGLGWFIQGQLEPEKLPSRHLTKKEKKELYSKNNTP